MYLFQSEKKNKSMIFNVNQYAWFRLPVNVL